MHFITIDECYKKAYDIASILESEISAIFALYNALASLIVLFNTFAYIILIVTGIINITQWRSLIYLTVVCLIELFISKYIRFSCMRNINIAKKSAAKTLLNRCDEYKRIEKWEQEVIFNKMLEEYMGIPNSK